MGFMSGFGRAFRGIHQQAAHIDNRGASKMYLRVALIVSYFVVAGTMGRMIPSAYGQFDFEKAGFYFIPLALAFVWSFVNIVYPLQQEKPVRSYVNIPFDTLFFLGFVVVAVLQTRAARIAYNYQQHQDEYHIAALFDMPPTVGGTYDNAPVMGALARTGKATSSQITSINQGKQYTYTTSPAFASIQNLGFNIVRNTSSVDYTCPNWDTCQARDLALNGFNYASKLGLAVGILFCLLAALTFVQVIITVLDSFKAKKERNTAVAAPTNGSKRE